MKLFFFLLFILSCSSSVKRSPSASACTFPEGAECNSDEFCIFRDVGEPICQRNDPAPPTIRFPIGPEHGVICTQPSHSKKVRTHSYLNTAYAIDLASPKHKSSARIEAIFSGRVVSSGGCDNRDDEEFNNDPCGYGFGNWVIVMDESSDLMAFYAHLSRLHVEDGQKVKAGQLLGMEGKTGQAGHRHLHFSVHRNTLGLTPEKIHQYGIWLPPSIPFKTYIRNQGRTVLTEVTKLPCLDSNDLTREPFFGANP